MLLINLSNYVTSPQFIQVKKFNATFHILLDYSNIEIIMQRFKEIKLVNFYKVLSTLFCLVGLLYQTSKLWSQYMFGKTVVNIEVKRQLYDNFPAITVCFKNMLSFESLANYSTKYLQYYYEYEEIVKIIEINKNLYQPYMSNLTFHYQKTLQFFHSIPNNSDVIDIFIDKLTIPYQIKYFQLIIDGTFRGKYKMFCPLAVIPLNIARS